MLVNDFYLILPELYLIFSILLILILNIVFALEIVTIGKVFSLQICAIVIGLFCLILLLEYNISFLNYFVFGTIFYVTSFGKFFNILILVGIIFLLGISYNYFKTNNLNSNEFFLIIALILLGFNVLLYANDLLSFYMGIELQSLGMYLLAVLKQNSIYATEAGLKYFVLGAVSSSLLILGISIVYSVFGLISFTEIKLNLINLDGDSIRFYGNLVGFILILISLLFKVGSVPFHVWLPDVYEGVSMLITTFFAVIPKIVIFSIIIKLCNLFGEIYFFELHFLLLTSSLLSIGLGSYGALYQNTIKRLISYSAIGHTGYILLGISLFSTEGLVSTVFYILVYFIMSLSLFAIIGQFQRKNTGLVLKYLNNFGYVYKNNKTLGSLFIIILFTFAGVPPLSGFFSKLHVFIALMDEGYYFLSVIIILLSVVSCVYYLKVIRNTIVIVGNKNKNYLLNSVSTYNSYLIVILVGLNFFFFFGYTSLLYCCYNISFECLF